MEVDAQPPIEADDAQDEVQPVNEQPDAAEVVSDDESEDETKGTWQDDEIDKDAEVDELLTEMHDDEDTHR